MAIAGCALSRKSGKGFDLKIKIKGGVIPREYVPAIQKGVREAVDKGVLLDIR